MVSLDRTFHSSHMVCRLYATFALFNLMCSFKVTCMSKWTPSSLILFDLHMVSSLIFIPWWWHLASCTLFPNTIYSVLVSFILAAYFQPSTLWLIRCQVLSPLLSHFLWLSCLQDMIYMQRCHLHIWSLLLHCPDLVVFGIRYLCTNWKAPGWHSSPCGTGER